MTATEIIAAARRECIQVTLQGESLVLDGKPQSAPELVGLLRQHKAEIVALLSQPKPTNAALGVRI
jgi:hypothetical protein